MERKQYQRKRGIYMRFMVDERERDLIYERMNLSGIKSLQAYMIKQALEGRIITIELDSVKEMVRLLSNATNNINQIARRVNQGGSFNAADFNVIQKNYETLWVQAKEILRRLSAL